jgi:hypothetical protein
MTAISFGFARYLRGFAANARSYPTRRLREVVETSGHGADLATIGHRRYMQNAAANGELRPLQTIRWASNAQRTSIENMRVKA